MNNRTSKPPPPPTRRTIPTAIPTAVKRDGAGVRQPAAPSGSKVANARTKNKLATDDSVIRKPAARGHHSTTNDTPRPSRIPQSRTQMKQNKLQKDKVAAETTEKRRPKTCGPTPVKPRISSRAPTAKPAEPAPKLGLRRNPKTLILPPDTVKRTRPEKCGQDPSDGQTPSTIPNEEKEIASSSQDLAVVKHPSKLPVPDKTRSDVVPTTVLTTDNTTEMLTKVVGLETLYAVLSEEHLGLQMSAQEAWRVANAERARRRAAEAELQALSQAPANNPINLALAHQIQELQAAETQLRQENSDLKEELELLEFRILEMDSSPKRAVSRSSDARCDVTEIDDVSDSGVMSLPTSEDDPQDFTIENEKDRDVKSRLMEMCKLAESVSERICLQQAVALIRHYEGRIENLESTISAMCHEASMTRTLNNLRNEIPDSPVDSKSSGGRIIATVLPFTDPGAERKEGEEGRRIQRDSDCLQESGIFEDAEPPELLTTGTQTEPESPGDLTQEIRKLTQIRERIEEQGSNKKLLLSPAGGDYTPTLKEVLFYRERLEALESRLAVYESSGEDQLKRLSARLQKETLLTAQVRQLNEKLRKLEEENKRLDEERCELEEAENDTRLRCQKLELKLSALGEKKSSLKVQLQQASRVISSLRSSMAEEEKKQNEARQQANRLEALVHSYEQKNFELEEREMEVKYRLQMLENTMPALMMWNMWRMMCAMQGGSAPMGAPPPAVGQPIPPRPPSDKEEELLIKLKALETKLANENRLLEESRRAEDSLRNKVKELEKMVNSKDDEIIEILDRDPEEDVAVFEKLGKMAKDRLEMDKRIKDLEMKERLYQETLQQADTMFAEMEGGYAKQIQEKDEEIEEKSAELSEKEAELSVKEAELQEKEAKLVESQTKLKNVSVFSEISSHLQEKIDALEAEVGRLKNALSKREKEREILEQEQQRLNQELQERIDELDALKQNMEPLKSELDAEKKKAKALRESLQTVEEELAEKEEDRVTEVSKLKWQISRLTRDMMENEVTISELREEVQTLEATVDELRFTLVAEKESQEDLKKLMEAELEKKEKAIDELRMSLKEEPKRKSLKEELEEIPTAEMIDQEIASSKGEFRKTSVVEVIGEVESGGLEPIKEEEEDEEMDEQRPTIQDSDDDLGTGGLKTRSARQLQAAILDIENKEYQVDKDAISEVPIGGQNKLGIFRMTECQIAQNAVAGVSGRDLKGTVTNLSKAYHHSKTCKECGDTLGVFLEELIQQLGVKLPRVKKAGEFDDPQYAGQPSTMKTKEMGPGTVMWDPKNNDAGYRMRPTMSSLALTVDELEDKCRLKDHLIQKMADELKSMGRCQNWSNTQLIESVSTQPVVNIDFDRRALCTYLKAQPPHGLASEQEQRGDDVEYAATNPLGLSVLRQVGPDSLLLQWAPPPLEKKVFAFEIFINGLFIQRVRCPGRNKALIHPIDLTDKVYITLNAVTYTGEPCEAVTIEYGQR